MDQDDVRLSVDDFFVADRDPVFFLDVIKNILAARESDQQRFKVGSRAGEDAVVSAVIDQHFDGFFPLEFFLNGCDAVFLILDEGRRGVLCVKDLAKVFDLLVLVFQPLHDLTSP